ncbi:ABC transporter ATP-binding protein [Leeuwenhoekiella marinoflava]|uniref:ATP-binding cassette subfamily B protein n=2 Tax=Leeuwenhoekiella marinoflava TaxID=988 RepID=A0A4Q0PPS8_9FLAO|nr:ABC transporter ATP-binding protein [Leeuwenhoekiella marinoflava]RXG32547.1 ATP-binding cassette subfamily B protein [Leeuwenhoekiella marinoflava]SHE67747.1 ATP-binding cassette, subfamily B [Leeuwenhoekiella marinoflava DSM 3653]
MKELQHLNKYFKKYKWKLILGFFIVFIARIFAILTPKFSGDMIKYVEDFLNNGGEISELKHQLLVTLLMLLGAALFSAFFTFLMRQMFIVVSRYMEADLKNEVYEQYQNLSLNFYKKNRTGDLMNRISEDVSKVRMYLGPAIMYGVTTVILFATVIPYMYYSAPELTLYVLIPLPILSVAIYQLSRLIHKRSTVVQQYLSHLSTFTQESFSGIGVIKAYGIEPQTYKNFEELSETNKDKNLDLVKVQAFFFPLMIALIGVSNLLVIYIGGRKYINGSIPDLGVIVEFLIYVNMLTWPVASVGWITSLVQQAEASQKRINEFLNEKPDIVNHTKEHTPIEGSIRFDKVTFTYEDTNITALKDVSFEVNKGETLAIIGKTGSGKSTILELIGRLYDTTNGAINIDKTPIEKLNLKDLRTAIGYVPQEAFLFSDSIKENIKFGKKNASDEEVIAAAKNAVVHKNIVDFSKAYDTILGERGITLSGGQKQRVSIARAIIKDPQILLFDDSLSAVDTETEEEILSNLKNISTEKTTILVSHRISSAKNADKIIILEEGEIIQQGTHEDLVKQPGYYQELYRKQLDEKEME